MAGRVVAVDTGGTFTDLVAWDGAQLIVHKEPSTPDDPARAVLSGLAALVGSGAVEWRVLYGSTVATNAVLERAGADVVLVTTAGFEDVLELGRQDRPDIYALHPTRPPPLVPAARRLGLAERLGPGGSVEQALSSEEADRVARRVVECGCASVAVCLLHAYADPSHEVRFEAALRAAGFTGPVACSHRVLPEYREYERTSTTCLQAYVAPKMEAHLGRLETALRSEPLLVMLSNGGASSSAEARAHAVRTLLSGPAGGVQGAGAVARATGRAACVSFDMGGTSTDVALWAGAPTWTREGTVGGLPVGVPMLDIHTVGAGGGSLARRDEGGALAVGPESAGASPGPACYGRGGARPTVTDAHLVLGRLVPERFLGGEMTLDAGAARAAVSTLAEELGLGTEEAAAGIVRVANATMERALKRITLARGHDPRGLALVSFGGAGGLHAARLAAALGMPEAVVPDSPGVLSAFGFLQSDLVRDATRTVLVRVASGAPDPVGSLEPIRQGLAALEGEVRSALRRMGMAEARIGVERLLDLRYEGQAYELTVPAEGARAAFHAAHAARYGHAHPGRALEIVNVRVRGVGETDKPPLEVRPEVSGLPEPVGVSAAWWAGVVRDTPRFVRGRLAPGHRLTGPALVCEYSATTVVPPGWEARVDRLGSLVLRPVLPERRPVGA